MENGRGEQRSELCAAVIAWIEAEQVCRELSERRLGARLRRSISTAQLRAVAVASPRPSPETSAANGVRGYNHNVTHAGRTYHVQTEDMGLARARVISHLYLGGLIVTSVDRSYDDLLEASDRDARLRTRMQEQHKTLMRRLIRGHFEQETADKSGATLLPVLPQVCVAPIKTATAAQQNEAQKGEAQKGEAQKGEAQRGEAQRGEAQRGEAQRGEAKRDEAKQDEAKQDEAEKDEPITTGFGHPAVQLPRDNQGLPFDSQVAGFAGRRARTWLIALAALVLAALAGIGLLSQRWGEKVGSGLGSAVSPTPCRVSLPKASTAHVATGDRSGEAQGVPAASQVDEPGMLGRFTRR